MSDNKNLLVRLKPAGRFFFGTGGGSGKQDYYLQTAYFPQQTALLGLIRHQLLIQNNLLSTPASKVNNQEGAIQLVGESSFLPDVQLLQQFGRINSIGPCGIYHSDLDELFLPYEPEYCNTYNFEMLGGIYYRAEDKIRSLAVSFSHFNHKKEYPQRFIGNKGSSFTMKEIFETAESPGKDYTGKTATNAYYKQNWLRFKSRHLEFGFNLNLNTKDIGFEDNLVGFGKERSVFALSVQAWSYDQENNIPPVNPGKIILTSDARLRGNEFCRLADFSINSNKPFRNYINRINQPVKDYYNRRTSDSNLQNIQLLERGSVFFFSNAGNLKLAVALLEKETQYRNIGYNHYTIC
jgi:CRISPR-associated protein Cmr3